MSPAALAFQAAVAARLRADPDLAGLVGGRIFDVAPRGTAFPSVVIGEGSSSDWGSGTEDGAALRLALHVWSRAAGKREAWSIAGVLMRLLHDAPLALEGYALVLVRVDFAEVRLDPDGITEHGVVRLSALVEG